MSQMPDSLHPYANEKFFERVTPIEDIPEEFRMEAVLPGGNRQIVDRRLAYNWNPKVMAFVECGSVAGDACYED